MSVLSEIRDDIRAAVARDPAARSGIEVFLFYPGFHARVAHRLAHALFRRRVPLLPRGIMHVTRFLTGIEIHPGAVIGPRFFKSRAKFRWRKRRKQEQWCYAHWSELTEISGEFES